MNDIQYRLLTLGQDLMDHVEDHPDEAEGLLERFSLELQQIKSGNRDKSIEGSYRPTNKNGEFTMSGQQQHSNLFTVKTKSGEGVKIDDASMIESIKAARDSDPAHFYALMADAGVPASIAAQVDTSSRGAANIDALQKQIKDLEAKLGVKPVEVKEAPLLSKADERAVDRQAEMESRVTHNWRRQLRRIGWELVEFMGQCLIVIGAIVGGLLIVRAVFPMPAALPVAVPA